MSKVESMVSRVCWREGGGAVMRTRLLYAFKSGAWSAYFWFTFYFLCDSPSRGDCLHSENGILFGLSVPFGPYRGLDDRCIIPSKARKQGRNPIIRLRETEV
jgi:hypothetical protein